MNIKKIEKLIEGDRYIYLIKVSEKDYEILRNELREKADRGAGLPEGYFESDVNDCLYINRVPVIISQDEVIDVEDNYPICVVEVPVKINLKDVKETKNQS